MDSHAGSTLMQTYTRPKPLNDKFFPTISSMTASYPSHTPPHGITHSLSLPWRPSTYYKVAQVHPTLGKFVKTIPSTLDRIPPLSASNRTALFTRYSSDDWMKATAGNYRTAECWRSSSEQLRGDTTRLVHDRKQVTEQTQKETGKNIGERVSDINFWKSEIRFEIGKVIAETNQLLEQKKRLERAIKETEGPLQNAQECLYHREQRQGIDLVHDEVEKELLREVEVIKACEAKMRRFVDKASVQLSHNRAAQHELERDNNDKFIALRIDGKCHRLKNTSDGIAFHRGVEKVDATVSTPETWVKFTDDNVLRSQSERANSAQLRDDIDNLLVSTSEEMWSQFNNVNVAFANRIASTLDAKNKLQMHLAKTLKEIFNTEQTINEIKRSIVEKEVYMKVAQTRLDERTRRPNVELCRDPPQLRLVDEVALIDNTIRMLKSRLREEEDTLQGLVHTRAMLEHDLQIKTNTLFVDQDKCMSMRRTYTAAPRLVGYI